MWVIYKASPTNFSEILGTYSKSCCVKHIQRITFGPASTVQHLNQSASTFCNTFKISVLLLAKDGNQIQNVNKSSLAFKTTLGLKPKFMQERN